MVQRKPGSSELSVREAQRLLQRIATVNATYRELEQQRRRLMLEANDGGVSTQQIADKTGESRGSVAHWIRIARTCSNEPSSSTN